MTVRMRMRVCFLVLLASVGMLSGWLLPASAHAESRWVTAAKKLLTKPGTNKANNPPPVTQAPPPTAPPGTAAAAPPAPPPAQAVPVPAPATPPVITASPVPAAPQHAEAFPAEAKPPGEKASALQSYDWMGYVESNPARQWDEFNEGEDGCCDEKFLGVKILSEEPLSIVLLHGGRTGRSVELKWDYYYFAVLRKGRIVEFDPGRMQINVPGYAVAVADEVRATVQGDELVLPFNLKNDYSGKPLAVATTYWKLIGKNFKEQIKRREIATRK